MIEYTTHIWIHTAVYIRKKLLQSILDNHNKKTIKNNNKK